MIKMKNNGFSVIELLVSVIIIGVMLGMVLTVGRHTIKKAEFSSSLNEFISNVSYARQLASRENRFVAVVFDSSNTNYTIRIQNSVSGNLGADEGDTDYNFSTVKTVELGIEKQFVDSSLKGFMINSIGETYDYPYDFADPNPVPVTIRFYKSVAAHVSGSVPYEQERYVTITPLGGIKVEEPDEYAESNK